MSSDVTYDLSLLDRSAAKWRSSAALRAVYGDIFHEVERWLAPGRTLEIGSGIGAIRNFLPDVVTSDIAITPYVSRVVSAYEIPEEGWGNIVGFDVLHHLCDPMRFFASAARALVPGGRIILAEPAATPGGRLIYRLFHHEPCRPSEIVSPFVFKPGTDGSFANMGMAQGLFSIHRAEADARFKTLGLRVMHLRHRDLLAYPVTGGFSKPTFLPAQALRVLLACERVLPQPLMRLAALRVLIVIEKEG